MPVLPKKDPIEEIKPGDDPPYRTPPAINKMPVLPTRDPVEEITPGGEPSYIKPQEI